MGLSTETILKKTGLPTASNYQIAVFRHVADQVDNLFQKKEIVNLVVQAVAGSGKTTTAVAMANLFPTTMKACFLAFGKDIADELDIRLPRHFWAKTLNSLGWGICKRYADGLVGRRIDNNDFMNKQKIWQIIRELFTKPEVKEYGKDIKWVVEMARNFGIVPAPLEGKNHVSVNGLRDTEETWNSIIRHFNYQIDPDVRPTVIEMARKVLVKDLEMETVIDFGDQKYFPAVKRMDDGSRLPAWKFDAIIIDELQDVNAVDIELIKLVTKEKDGKLCSIIVGVGDNRQAIYGFRGADVNAIENFKKEFNATELPLSITYRCAQKIVEHARKIYPGIEAAPNAKQGSVESLREYDVSVFNPQNNDMIECRNNAPIVAFAYKLIRNRIPIFVKGRDIGHGLLSLIDNLDAEDVVDLNAKLMLWHQQQVRIIEQEDPDNEDAIEKLNDRYETLKVFIDENTDGRVDSVRDAISDLFRTKSTDKKDKYDMKGKVVLSTIHKAKGLEADTVFFLDSFLMMPRWIEPGSWQEQQETNLLYVAVTRAKNRLVFIDGKNLKN